MNALFRFPSAEDVSDYGVARVNDNCDIMDFQEKQKLSTFRDVSTACYMLRKADVALLSEYVKEGNDPDSLGSFVRWLTIRSSIAAYRFSSFWFDVGTRAKLLQANWHHLQDLRGGRVCDDSRIEGPVQLEPSSVVREQSHIGPNVYLGHRVDVAGSEIVDSIIMDDSVVRNSRISSSVIGPGSKIEGTMYETVCGPKSYILTPITTTA